MGNTDLNGLPYPEGTEQPYVHLDMKALAEAVAEKLYVECTSIARPPHRNGRRIYETDTGLSYVSNGATWRPLATMSPAVAIALAGTAGNTWQKFGGAGVGLDPVAYRIGGEVQGVGLISGASGTGYLPGNVIATFPPGHRPGAPVHRTLASQSGYVVGRVDTAGAVVLLRFDGLAAQHWVDLSAFRFPAAAV